MQAEGAFAQTASALLGSTLPSHWWLLGRRVFASVVHNKDVEGGLEAPVGWRKRLWCSRTKPPQARLAGKSLLQQGHHCAQLSDVLGC